MFRINIFRLPPEFMRKYTGQKHSLNYFLNIIYDSDYTIGEIENLIDRIKKSGLFYLRIFSFLYRAGERPVSFVNAS
jgi:hypothetical protein